MDKKPINVMEGLVMVRPKDGGEWDNAQTNIIHMLSHMVKYMGLACQRQSWPELFKLMSSGDTSDAELTDQVRRMHITVAELLRALDYRDTEAQEQLDNDHGIYGTLDRIGWKNIPVEGRTTYLAMLGMYLLSRIWVLGRQNVKKPFMQDRLFETVAYAAGDCFRNYDQGTTSVPQAQTVLTQATVLGKAAGLTEEQMLDTVRHAYRANTQEVPDTAALSRLSVLQLDGDSNESA